MSESKGRTNRYGDWIGYEDRLSLGSVVVDAEQSPAEQDEAIVVAAPDARLPDWTVGGRAVAEDNPDYDDSEWITIVVFKDVLVESYPYYSGIRPLSLPDLNKQGISHYAFPDSRLKRVGKQRTHEIPLGQIQPSPLHLRSFDFDIDQSYLDNCRERGTVTPYPTLRVKGSPPMDDPSFEIIDGHKRIWIAHELGFDVTKCHVTYCDSATAARTHLEKHKDTLSPPQRELIEQRVHQRWPDASESILTPLQ